MCGLAGAFGRDPNQIRTALRLMVSAQAHRGPDDEGIELLELKEGCLGLGHRRLSVIDLSPAGHQPMADVASGTWIVFNGEIYNHHELRSQLEGEGASFRSQSDTEVILKAYVRWGHAAFTKLEGMFSICIYDRAQQSLCLVRDPLGIKPLYYVKREGFFAFASEARALAASELFRPELNHEALLGVLAYGSVQRPLSMWKHVRELEPGCSLHVSLKSLGQPARTHRFWSFPTVRRELRREEAVEELSLRLRRAMKNHLLSDVPVGVFLSSGIDSSLIASLCTQVSDAPIKTFTVSFDDELLNEGPVAARTAAALGSDHRHVLVDRSTARNFTHDWLTVSDQPSLDGLNTYIVSKAVREQGIVVALSGLGGDELFGGYSSFHELPWIHRLVNWMQALPVAGRGHLAHLLTLGKEPLQQRKAVDLLTSSPDLVRLYLQRRRLFSSAEIQDLFGGNASSSLDESFEPAETDVHLGVEAGDAAAALRVLESRFYMANTLLRDSDVFSMASSLELRVPLLDLKVAEWAFSIPGKWLSSPRANKQLLVDAAKARLSREVTLARKRGFSLPQSTWMLGPLRETFVELLGALNSSGLMNPRTIEKTWTDFLRNPQGPSWSRVWLLGALGHWLRRQGFA